MPLAMRMLPTTSQSKESCAVNRWYRARTRRNCGGGTSTRSRTAQIQSCPMLGGCHLAVKQNTSWILNPLAVLAEPALELHNVFRDAPILDGTPLRGGDRSLCQPG